MTYQGNKFGAIVDRCGFITIVRISDGANCFLQGDDTLDLQESLLKMDSIDYPTGPFQTYEQHLDAVLDQYETIMQAVSNVR